MNKVILMGRLTRDPELRYAQNSDNLSVVRFSLAVDRRFKKPDDKETADFINCVAFSKTAEFISTYFKMGLKVSVVGSLRVSKWTDQQGQNRWSTDVVVEEAYFAESKSSFETRKSQDPSFGFKDNDEPAKNEQPGFTPITDSIDDDDDFPF